jgi:hypothetical protein
MPRWLTLVALLGTSCGHNRPNAFECKALAAPKAVLQRCVGGNLTGKYVGDLKCWPFSQPQRMHGVWVIAMEASNFYPNASTVTSRETDTWLKTDLLNRPELIAAAQGAGTRAYLVDFIGRKSLCDGYFGNGTYRREVIAEHFYSLSRLPIPPT